MKLEEVLQSKPQATHTDVHLYSMNGVIKLDHDNEYIRVYANPVNNSVYFLVKKMDVIGDVYKWSNEELVQIGFVGEEMHRIRLKSGTKVQSIKITLDILGETIDGNILYNPNKIKSGESVKCKRASGCGAYPCCEPLEDGRCKCSLCCDA